ncbi:hypothetical protein [Mycobacterium heckeshornense]|uniref:hypothetical protein n=1 Tax=Mycobacterium heckeshornense TaxID=110505 RepID=UPI0006627FA5|nr:hypothetical protein [Mycobacterium heckeshornense]KMV22089.1 hypothetical protein ACT16_13310 [Mycobacterium heckeshornense]
MSAWPVPTIADFQDPDEILIVFHDSGPDVSGRRYFFGYWIAENIGRARNHRGVFGEAFCTFLDQFMARGRRPVRIFTGEAPR